MFTGIIEAVGRLGAKRASGAGVRLEVEAPGLGAGVAPGDSVAVNGVCLTATDVAGDTLRFDVVRETIRRSTLDRLVPGAPVNVERALRADGRVSGHFVQGHVDGVASVIRAGGGPGRWTLVVRAAAEAAALCVVKGSVALDGVSLTLAAVEGCDLTVALVPFTLEHTTLGEKAPGDAVNLEVDILAKLVARQMGAFRAGEGLTEEALRAAGFSGRGPPPST